MSRRTSRAMLAALAAVAIITGRGTAFAADPARTGNDGIFVYDPMAVVKRVNSDWKAGRQGPETQEAVEALKPPAGTPYRWKSQPPENHPFPVSNEFEADLLFTGRGRHYRMCDTIYPSWGEDGNLYSPAADGALWGVRVGSWLKRTGNLVIKGDDPLDLTFEWAPTPYIVADMGDWSPYPSACLMYNGVWYYANYGLLEYNKKDESMFVTTDTPPFEKRWPTYPVLGPMTTFRTSSDNGLMWTPHPATDGKEQDPRKQPWDMTRPMFPETRKIKTKFGKLYSRDSYSGTIKMGAPHFVDFGRNMEHSPDGKAYLLGHGGPATNEYRLADVSWCNGDQIFAARVKPDPETINDLSSWEFYAGKTGSGEKVWSSDWDDIQPLLEWNDNMGIVTAFYNAPLKRYFMWVTAGWPTVGPKDSYLLVSETIEGPWKIVSYLRNFGASGYFLNTPTKFISEDGLTLWLMYSIEAGQPARVPLQSGYGCTAVELKLEPKQR